MARSRRISRRSEKQRRHSRWKWRADLIRQFGSAPGRERVGVGTYLELEYHWEAVLVGIMKHSWEHKGKVHPDVVENVCIKVLYLNQPSHGLVVGNINARRCLIVSFRSFVHFEPVLPFWA